MLVYGASGEITGLELVAGDHEEELHKKTQRLLDRTDGPLHRDVARHLVRDANPGERADGDQKAHQRDAASYGFETYNMLVNPNNRLVKTVLTRMVEKTYWWTLSCDPPYFTGPDTTHSQSERFVG